MVYKQELIEKLAKLEIFSDLDIYNEEHVRLLKRVCEILNPTPFDAGAIIIKEGDIGNSLYILYEGTVQVRRMTPNNEQFAVANLTAEQNVFFGEVALVDKDTRSASVYAITKCYTLKLDGDQFKALCDEEPVLGYNVMYRISRRIASALRRSNKDLMVIYEALIDEVHGE
ncbi:MAG: cyclic nucleotide-binding domain-containing protein [Spirochaetaceae bacterium]|nr:cyclic nucleotide-binding domain-containing protein [Spirochaetaceae bacterium]